MLNKKFKTQDGKIFTVTKEYGQKMVRIETEEGKCRIAKRYSLVDPWEIYCSIMKKDDKKLEEIK